MKSLLLMLSLALAGTLYGQDTLLTQRIYFSAQEIIDHPPSDTTSVLKLIPRKKSEIKMGGGNDYKLEGWTEEENDNDYLRNQIWAVECNDTLYLNGYHVTQTKWYAKAETRGKFILIYSALPTKKKVAQELGLGEKYKQRQGAAMAAGMFGLLGAAIATAANGQGTLDRYPILYDIAQNKAYYPQAENMLILTDGLPQLQEKYAQWQIDSVDKSDVIGFVEELNRT